jgi:hypothetical protein
MPARGQPFGLPTGLGRPLRARPHSHRLDDWLLENGPAYSVAGFHLIASGRFWLIGDSERPQESAHRRGRRRCDPGQQQAITAIPFTSGLAAPSPWPSRSCRRSRSGRLRCWARVAGRTRPASATRPVASKRTSKASDDAVTRRVLLQGLPQSAVHLAPRSGSAETDLDPSRTDLVVVRAEAELLAGRLGFWLRRSGGATGPRPGAPPRRLGRRSPPRPRTGMAPCCAGRRA